MASFTYFTIEADFLSVIGDSFDVGVDPDTVAIRGKVKFSPVLNPGDMLLATTLTPRPAAVLPAPVDAIIDSDGRLKRNNVVGVRLIANTAVLELESDLYYRVEFSEVAVNGTRVTSPRSFTFEAPNSDVTLNLVDVARAPGTVASGITKIAPGEVRRVADTLVFSFASVDIPDPIDISDLIFDPGVIDGGAP